MLRYGQEDLVTEKILKKNKNISAFNVMEAVDGGRLNNVDNTNFCETIPSIPVIIYR